MLNVLLLTAAVTAATPADRPNVVLVMADDLGAECLSCYGCLDDKTPNLDALAASGARFTNAFSQPLCTLTRVQAMTGKYNFRSYVEFGYLSPDQTTFGDLFRVAGYRTCVAGKWQLTGQGRQYPEKTDPADWGFDEYSLWQLNNRAPFGDRGSRYWQPYVEQNGEVVEAGPDDYGPDVTTDFLLDFVARNKDRPFAYHPLILTHGPFEPTPKSARRGGKGPRNFKDMVEYMDLTVGRIVARLDELGLADRTVLIFTGDNGTGREITTRTASGVVHGGKGTTTDAGMRVPLIVRWPGKVAPGIVTDRLVDFTDFVPLLLAATGTAAPEGFKTDGVPFLDAAGLATREREWVYSWYDPRQGAGLSPNSAVLARDRRYQLYVDGRFLEIPRPWAEAVPLTGDLSLEAAKAKGKLQAVIERFVAEGAFWRTASVPRAGGRGRRQNDSVRARWWANRRLTAGGDTPTGSSSILRAPPLC
jgi:arylsulfatase A